MRKELFSALGGLLMNAVTEKNEKGAVVSRSVRVDAADFGYQIYVPAKIESARKLPLVVFLHGIGQRGSGGFLPTEGAGGALARHYLGQVPAIILLPQCRPGSYWSDPVMDEMVLKAAEQTADEFGADDERKSLIGVSMGGYGVWHFAAAHPRKFAALVSICGGSPVLTGERFAPVAEKVGATPTWVFHGADDPIVPVGESREMVKTLEAVGNNVRYSEFAGVGHNVWMNVLAEKELLPWLLSQRLK